MCLPAAVIAVEDREQLLKVPLREEPDRVRQVGAVRDEGLGRHSARSAAIAVDIGYCDYLGPRTKSCPKATVVAMREFCSTVLPRLQRHCLQ